MARGMTPRRVLVMCPSDPMEAVLMTPALRALHNGGSTPPSVDLVVFSSARRVAEIFPFSDDILTADRSQQSFTAKIGEGRYDAAVIFTDSYHSPYPEAYLCYLAGIPIRVGLSAEFGGGVLSHWVKPLPEADPIDRHLMLIESIGFQERGHYLELRVPRKLQAKVDAEIRAAGLGLDERIVSIFCRGKLGSDLAGLLSTGRASDTARPPSSKSQCFLVDVEGRLSAVLESDRGEDVEAAIATRSSLVVTDSALTACLSQAVGSRVLYTYKDTTDSDNNRLGWFASTGGMGQICGGDGADALSGYIGDIMGFAVIGREEGRYSRDYCSRTGGQ